MSMTGMLERMIASDGECTKENTQYTSEANYNWRVHRVTTCSRLIYNTQATTPSRTITTTIMVFLYLNITVGYVMK